MELLMGYDSKGETPIANFVQMGYHGFPLKIYNSNIDFLRKLNESLTPIGDFHDGIITNWKFINEIFYTVLTTRAGTQIDLNPICSLIAFPILEEMTRVISKWWDEDGKLLKSINVTDGVIRWKESGSEQVEQRIGKTISSLEIKFQLFLLTAKPKTRELIEHVDSRFQRPIISGLTNSVASPISAKLYYWRNKWMHGYRYDGWEGVLVSHLLALIYYGEQF
jgi:hypothetical protein